jgi:hypothetical protein
MARRARPQLIPTAGESVNALLGAIVFTSVALLTVIVDLLRAHGRVLRALHAIDRIESDARDRSGRIDATANSASRLGSSPTPPRS